MARRGSGLLHPAPHRLHAVTQLISDPLHRALRRPQLFPKLADQTHRPGLILGRITPRRRPISCIHDSILVSKLRSLHSTQGDSPKAKPDTKPDEPTNATSPTESSDECGETNKPDDGHSPLRLDKGASNTPGPSLLVREQDSCLPTWPRLHRLPSRCVGRPPGGATVSGRGKHLGEANGNPVSLRLGQRGTTGEAQPVIEDALGDLAAEDPAFFEHRL